MSQHSLICRQRRAERLIEFGIGLVALAFCWFSAAIIALATAGPRVSAIATGVGLIALIGGTAALSLGGARRE